MNTDLLDDLTVIDGEIIGLNYCCIACAEAQAIQYGHCACVLNERAQALVEGELAYAVFDRDAWRLYTTTQYDDLAVERAALHRRAAKISRHVIEENFASFVDDLPVFSPPPRSSVIEEMTRLNTAMQDARDAVNHAVDSIARDMESDFVSSREWIIQRPERELHSAAREGVRVFFTAYLERWRALQYLAITGETWEEARERLTSSQVIPWED